AAGNESFLLRDVQISGPAGAKGSGAVSQVGIQLTEAGSADIEQATISGFSFGINGGASGTSPVRLARSLLSDDFEGVANATGTWLIDQNLFSADGTGVFTGH